MIKVYSHIESKSHFDALWNDRIDYLSTYFANTKNLLIAYNFKYFNFITKLYNSVLDNTLDSFSQYDLNIYLSDQTVPSDLINLYKEYETRKKSVNSNKLDQYVSTLQDHVVDKDFVIIPESYSFFPNNFFYSLYPSARQSLFDFLLKNELLVVNKKTFSITLKKYSCTIKDISTINSFTSYVKVDYLQKQSNFKQVLESIDDTISSLLVDKYYLEEHIQILSKHIDTLNKKIETQSQEGVNGYLLTWH
jgi:hypothetical protein